MKKKFNRIYTLLLFTAIAIISCTPDNSTSAGSSILTPSDEIEVKADTFAVQSRLDSCVAISLTPDSFLLGECETHFGAIKADILTQLACPEGFEYPHTINNMGEKDYGQLAVDSVCLYLYYKNWYGDGNSPLGISIYEMDKKTLEENGHYNSNEDITQYCSLSKNAYISDYSNIIIPNMPKDSSYSDETDSYISTIRIKLSDNFAQRFIQIRDFSSQKSFNQAFKGLYISTDFGGSNVLYVKDITMKVFYHFTTTRNNKDTVIHDTRSFYANEEVRQVNRYAYPNRQTILDQYSQINDTNYIVSPVNIYTELSFRMDSIYARMDQQLGDTSTHRRYINLANLTIDVLHDDTPSDRPRDNWDMPATHMMLVQKDHLQNFFSKNEVPADSVAIIATLSATADSKEDVSYHYTYDLSSFFTRQLRSSKQVDEIRFVLVPVTVQTNTSTGSILSVKPLQTITATCIRSANHTDKDKRMNIEMVYAGFSK